MTSAMSSESQPPAPALKDPATCGMPTASAAAQSITAEFDHLPARSVLSGNVDADAIPQDHTDRIPAFKLQPGDFLWRTPVASSFRVAKAVSDGTTVEILGEPNDDRSPLRTWLPASTMVRVTRSRDAQPVQPPAEHKVAMIAENNGYERQFIIGYLAEAVEQARITLRDGNATATLQTLDNAAEMFAAFQIVMASK